MGFKKTCVVIPFRPRKKEVNGVTILPYVSRAFAKSVDLNLLNINAMGYEYITKLSEGVYHAIASGADVCTNIDYILRVEYQVKACNVFECKKLLTLLDGYLGTPTISDSREKGFITHTRNKVFEQQEKLKTEIKQK